MAQDDHVVNLSGSMQELMQEHEGKWVFLSGEQKIVLFSRGQERPIKSAGYHAY
jgi:hypothetical protein